MNRDDFIKQAVASGKPRDEIQRIYEAADSAGDFDDGEPVQQPANRSYNYFKQDLAPAAKGLWNRFQNRSESIMAPTQTAEMFHVKPESTLADLIGAPERTVRAGLQAGGTLADIVGTGIGQVPALINRASGGRISESTNIPEYLGEAVQPLVDSYNEYKQKLSPGGQANLESTVGGAEFLSTFGAPGAASAAGKAAQNQAIRMTAQRLALKGADFAAGADPANIAKYGLIGTTAKTFHENAHGQIVNAANQLKAKIESIPFSAQDPNTRINLVQAMNRALGSAKGQTRTNVLGMESAYNELKQNLIAKYGLDFEKAPGIKNNVDLSEAQLLKREVGTRADWNEKHPQGNVDKAEFYNKFYDALKVELEGKGGPEVKELNQKMSDLIPLDRAAIKRQIVEDRRNPLSLVATLSLVGSTASGHALPLAVEGLNLASKAAASAKALYGAGGFTKAVGDALNPRNIGKRLRGGQEGFIGTKSNIEQSKWNRFTGKYVPDAADAMYFEKPRTLQEMRTVLERVEPAQRSEMIKRLKGMYPESEWKRLAPLLGTLAGTTVVSGAGLTLEEMLTKKKGK